MNKVDQLLQSLVRYDARNEPYTMTTERLGENKVCFTSEDRRLHIEFCGASTLINMREGFTITTYVLEFSTIGPTMLERIYPYLLWVMGVK